MLDPHPQPQQEDALPHGEVIHARAETHGGTAGAPVCTAPAGFDLDDVRDPIWIDCLDLTVLVCMGEGRAKAKRGHVLAAEVRQRMVAEGVRVQSPRSMRRRVSEAVKRQRKAGELIGSAREGYWRMLPEERPAEALAGIKAHLLGVIDTIKDIDRGLAARLQEALDFGSERAA